jgi:hypothetical protein
MAEKRRARRITPLLSLVRPHEIGWSINGILADEDCKGPIKVANWNPITARKQKNHI